MKNTVIKFIYLFISKKAKLYMTVTSLREPCVVSSNLTLPTIRGIAQLEEQRIITVIEFICF